MSKLERTIKLIIIVVGSVVAAYGITLALYAGFGGATLGEHPKVCVNLQTDVR